MLSQALKGETPARIALALENEERTLRSANVIGGGSSPRPPQKAAIRAAYETQYGGTMDEREYKAAHILVDTLEEAEALITATRRRREFHQTGTRTFDRPNPVPMGAISGWVWGR